MIDLKREHQGAIMEAGYIYLGMRRYKEARELFEGLVAIAPDSDVPLVALGNSWFCEGKLDSAIKCYKKALAKDPESLFAKVYMGEAFIFSGKIDEGLAQLEQVAKQDRGGAGDFAKALISAVRKGFKPKRKGLS